jgi:putative colanic acid biosynthesis acetyltransferase WcaF
MDLSKFKDSPLPNLKIKILYGFWLFISNYFFLTNIPFPSKFKILLLKVFGAKIGKKVVIKPYVKIKFPWNLHINDYVWLGENVWIDNLSLVSIGSNCCISQNSIILTGNHNYKKDTFDLMTSPITIEEEVWIGANCFISNGITIQKKSVILVSSTLTKSTEPNSIYQGNPAIKIKNR